MKRLLGVIGTAFLMSVLVVGTAFAGKTNGTGGGADNGTKNGTWHKNATQQCQDNYWLAYEGDYGAWAYDLNENGYVCVKWVDNDYFAVDDIAN
jgi:hypothetical protein